LADGLKFTLIVSAIGIVGALLIGILAAACRSERVPVLNGLTSGYVELYFALPAIGIKLESFTVAWLSLVLWGGAYQVENFRAGFEAVGLGYREAARALGLGRGVTFTAVVLPIGLRIALPSLANIAISILKNSSYMVAISFHELTDTAVNIVSLSFRVFEMFLVIGIIYLGIAWLLGLGAGSLERRLALPETR
jgi:His/Glu/Gln/Arg/opine family amino acid ABC transporter permease subunit